MNVNASIRSERGFTVSELVVAITIMGILSAIGVPSLSTMKAAYDLSVATNQLAFEISRSRMQAVGQNKYTRIRRLDSSVYARETSTDGTSYTQEATTTMPSDVWLGVSETGSATFNRSGLANTGTMYVLMKQVGNRYIFKTVTVSVLGRVTIS